ncbi:MAG: DUF6603 domain-containing protein [bacterium]
MVDERDTIAVIGEELAFAFGPLTSAFASPAALRDFLEEFGWDFAAPPVGLDNLRVAAGQALDLVEASDSLDAGQITQLLEQVRATFEAIKRLKTAAGLPNDFKEEFPGQLAQYLLVEYFLNHQPRWGYLLTTLGIIRLEEIPAQGSRLAFIRRIFAFSDFQHLFSDPLVFFKNSYQWGQSGFSGERLMANADALLTAWGIQPYLQPLDTATLSHLSNGALQPDEAFDTALRLVLIEDSSDAAQFNAGIGLYLLPETAVDKPGFALLPFANVELSETINITDILELGFETNIDLTGGIGIIVRPDRDVEFLTSLDSGIPSNVSGTLAIFLRLVQTGSPFVLIGSPTASRLEIAGASAQGGVRFHTGGKYEVFTEFMLEEGKIVINPAPNQIDGFLASVLPADGMKIEFDLTVGFSTTQGLYFGGSAGLEISLPIHIQLGPIEIQSAMLAIRPQPPAGDEPATIPVELAATIKGDFSVLKGVVENIGLKARFEFPPDGDGNLGPLDLSLAFKPPNGVGLAIDAGAVKGGGYLFFDTDREEYAGALELVFSEWIALKAIGLITTRLPDGSKGFSLLVIITVEFGSGIQIGFGFTLLGVGGLLGLKRIANVEPLKEGIRTGAVESVMFPQDVVANAPRIISDLRRFFPPHLEIFLVGPMAKIGWGTPPLISVSLGVIVEFPNVTITILGVVKVALPDEKRDILRLQVNFIGRVEPSNQLLWFYAELFDSRVLFLTLEGGMGVLVNWSDNANFVFSVGGFHPRYSPPPLPFPEPPRIAVSILNESWARVRIEGYFAVTSNSVQFGARAELYFGLSVFNLSGHLGFDALFQFNPFFFSFGLSFSLSVKVFGIGFFSVGFSGLLEGPTPWHIKGKGKISFFFFSISVPFEHTWGGSRETILDPIEVFPLLQTEFNALTNWEAVLPKSSNILVSLRKLGEADTEQLVLHPVGKLRISQRKIPVNFKLDKVGNQRPSDVNRLSVDAALPGGGNLSIAKVKEKFAIGQFKDLDDSKRLSRPAFEPLDSGIEIAVAGEQMKTSQATKRVIRYETIIIDNNFKRHVKSFLKFFDSGFALLNDFLFGHFLTGNAVTKSELSLHHKNRLQPFPEVIEIQPSQYSVVYDSNNMPVGVEATTFTSQAEAHEYMEEQIQSHPNLADNVHVIPNTEVELAV